MVMQTASPPYEAVLFDLLTALLDSWSLWDKVAGGTERGREWRMRYLELTYHAGRYRPYEELVGTAAVEVGLPISTAAMLLSQWNRLAPWAEAPAIVRSVGERLPVGVVTNCSESLARRAVARLGVAVAVVVSAERAGWYKPDRRPYELALKELELIAPRVLFVAGSPYDVLGASRVGMPVLWHNRAGLRHPTAAARTVAEVTTLSALPQLLSLT